MLDAMIRYEAGGSRPAWEGARVRREFICRFIRIIIHEVRQLGHLDWDDGAGPVWESTRHSAGTDVVRNLMFELLLGGFSILIAQAELREPAEGRVPVEKIRVS